MARSINHLIRLILSPIESFVGRLSDRALHASVLRSMPSLDNAIESARSRWPISEGDEQQRPVFVLSTGWRCGSTLLQRLILSSPEILMWGEPYAHCDYVRKMADSLRIFQDGLPREQFFIDHYLNSPGSANHLSDAWVANLYPMPGALIEAHREFFLRLYSAPAEQLGYSRWGIKEVRLSAEYAGYLKFLYPQAKFLFLYRSPYDSYRSYRSFRAWYDVWPDSPVLTATQFGALWKRLMDSFIDGHRRVGAMLVKYEDLCDGNIDLNEVSDYLGLSIDANTVEKTFTGNRAREREELSLLDRSLLKKAVNPTAKHLGYK